MALRDHPGGPWEQQDGHEVANNMIFVDFGVISGLVFLPVFGVQNVFKIVLFFNLFRFSSHFRVQNLAKRMGGIAKS